MIRNASLPAVALALMFGLCAPPSRAQAACSRANLSATAITAVKLAAKGAMTQALSQAGNDIVARKTVRWLWLSRNFRKAPATDLLAFADANRRWPRTPLFRAMGELKLLLFADESELARYFSSHHPATAAGRAAYARHLLARGKHNEARQWLRRAWLSPALPDAAERYVLKHMNGLLNQSDHVARLWRLIMAQRTRHAVRFASHLPAAYQRAATAARALMRRRRDAPALYHRLPASLRARQALRYALARYYRKTGRIIRALSVLKNLPADHARQLAPKRWWTEKRLIARYLLAESFRHHWRDAYRLAASHGFGGSGKPAYRGEFLAGFIAFYRLQRPKLALKHFLRLPKLAKSRTWKAKGWYWVGRARERLGDIAGARRAYRAAAKTPTVYYGLLAREKLGLGRKPVPLKMIWPSSRAKCTVASHELGRAVRLLSAAGERRLVRQFVWPLAYSFNRADELAAAAALLWDASGPANAVRLAKAAGGRGIDIDNYGYPLHALPKHRSRENSLELPVVLALTRQESEFDPAAGSHAGARGLMQLMPSTARLEARHLKVRFHAAWLTSRPAYNLLLGRHHLARIIAMFNGSYPLGFAAYNAGPGNVRKWLAAYGDMLSGRPDPITWVELIPITETRNYVQKVLQGVHVYRTRLKRPMQPLSKDLWRGVPGWREQVLKGGSKPEKAATGKAKGRKRLSPAGCGKKAKSIGQLIDAC